MNTQCERKLASVRRIAEIKPIENADAIEHVRVDGWWVVCKKGDFKVGDLAVYFEIDSWVPHELAPFLSKGKEPKEYNGVKGEKLRTVRLRKALSQGLLLPMIEGDFKEGDDLTEHLGIQKWEAPLPAELRGLVRSNFPSWMPKTDETRIQNLPEVFDDLDSKYEISLKLEGSSVSIACNKGDIHVCSRNLDLKLEGNDDNLYIRTAKESGIIEALLDYYYRTDISLAVQGELMGPGVQGNREGLDKHQIFVFNIWDIYAQRYFSPSERQNLCKILNLKHIPIWSEGVCLSNISCYNLDALLCLASQPWADWKNPVEGLVFKREDGKFSFKVINNEFLELQR